MTTRRRLLALGALAPIGVPARTQDAEAAALLARGGVVIAFRHALAPGTFDPPGFRLGDCATQRNLSDDGRAQARRIGAWFATRQLVPARVRSSPWCRCVDTAELAFGGAERWPALASPRAGSETTNARSRSELRAALVAAARTPGRFDAWVTHMFVLSDLVGGSTMSGEGLVLGVAGDGAPRVLARLSIA